MDKKLWGAILIIFIFGAMGDGFTTMTVLLGLFIGTDVNALAIAFAVIGAVFVTILTANHKSIFAANSPGYLKVMAVISFLIDILTAFVGSTYFIALKQPLTEPINFSLMTCCDFSNLYPTLGAFGVCSLLFLSTMFIVDIYQRFKDAN